MGRSIRNLRMRLSGVRRWARKKALVDCNAPEVFFGGARGGGKTDGVLGKWALKERRFGSSFNAVGFRRKQIYVPLGAKFIDRPARFKMPNGGRVSFSYLENTDDAQEYQGRNLTDAWCRRSGTVRLFRSYRSFVRDVTIFGRGSCPARLDGKPRGAWPALAQRAI
jgi:hypothetical protein